jgi:hypothetical protein
MTGPHFLNDHFKLYDTIIPEFCGEKKIVANKYFNDILCYNNYLPNTHDECCVCLNENNFTTKSNHNLCHNCYEKLDNKICPLCRKDLK